ncbi:MAG TPA: hypothetical protein VID67_14655 [Rhizomicrobium sp.]|jgi:hypothetical protein
MKNISRFVVAAALIALGGCSVWPVNQDPKGMALRRDANRVVEAIQAYHQEKGVWPTSLASLTPTYISALPGEPHLDYHPYDGSVLYHFIPEWPQLRPVWCQSVGATTEWRCKEKTV